MIDLLGKAPEDEVNITKENGEVETVTFPMRGFAQVLPYF